MVKTIIGGVDVQEYTVEYSCDCPPVFSDNEFRTASGKRLHKKIGDNATINIRLEEVPTSVSMALAEALEADEVEVDYTSPIPKRAKFYKTSYRADCEDGDPDDKSNDSGVLWNISLVLQSVAATAADGGDGL